MCDGLAELMKNGLDNESFAKRAGLGDDFPLPSTDELLAQYPVAEVFPGKSAPVKFAHNSDAWHIRTAIRNAVKDATGPTFAGHMIIAEWGCGSPCMQLAVIDMRNGNVQFVPAAATSGWAARKDSRLLVVDPPEATTDQTTYPPSYYLLGDDGVLREIKTPPPAKPGSPPLVAGSISVMPGPTFELDGKPLVFAGIVWPDPSENCGPQATRLPAVRGNCAVFADVMKYNLDQELSGYARVACTSLSAATCWVISPEVTFEPNNTLNGHLVESGWALSDPTQHRYDTEEKRADAHHAGLWGMDWIGEESNYFKCANSWDSRGDWVG
jgi:hypothetical protein